MLGLVLWLLLFNQKPNDGLGDAETSETFQDSNDEIGRRALTTPVGEWNLRTTQYSKTKNILAKIELASSSLDALLLLEEFVSLAGSGDYFIASTAAHYTSEILSQVDAIRIIELEMTPAAISDVQLQWLSIAEDTDRWRSLRGAALEIGSQLAEINQTDLSWETYLKNDSFLAGQALDLMSDTDFIRLFPKFIAAPKDAPHDLNVHVEALFCNRTPSLRKTLSKRWPPSKRPNCATNKKALP